MSTHYAGAQIVSRVPILPSLAAQPITIVGHLQTRGEILGTRRLSLGIVSAAEVSRGIYSDQDGALFEVITTAMSGEDFERVVVYRELFGDYRFWVAPIENFSALIDPSASARFTLVKTLWFFKRRCS